MGDENNGKAIVNDRSTGKKARAEEYSHIGYLDMSYLILGCFGNGLHVQPFGNLV